MKTIFFTLLINSFSFLNAFPNTTKVDYIKYAHKITKPFIEECEKAYQLNCIGTGGKFSRNVAGINLKFIAYRKGTIEEARKLEVTMIEKLLNHINTNEKIRPFLAEYPFKPTNLSISLSFRKPDDSCYNDGSVVFVFLGRKGFIYCSEDPKTGQLTDITEEPYEEALKIVLGTTP